jgi:two-component sensor histidine kinase
LPRSLARTQARRAHLGPDVSPAADASAGTPVAALTAPLWRELAITASIGGILLVIGLLFAIGMATRTARGEMLNDLLINELNHRVKNTLATVQSIASSRSAAPTMC